MHIHNVTLNTTAKFSCYPDDPEMLMSEEAKINYLALAGMASFTGIVSVSLNTIFLLILFQHKSLRTRSNILLAMLACSDVLTCIFIFPPYISFMIFLDNGQIICEISRFMKVTGYSTTMMSMATLTAITVDLFIAVVKPYVYVIRFQPRVMVKVLILMWVLILTLSVISMYVFHAWRIYMMVAGAVTIILFILMCLLRIKVSKETHKMCTVVVPGTIVNCTLQKKTLKLASTVLTVFGIIYIPSIIIIVYKTTAGSSSFIKTFVDQWCEMLALTNPLWNPLVYYYRMKMVRKKLRIMLSCSSNKI